MALLSQGQVNDLLLFKVFLKVQYIVELLSFQRIVEHLGWLKPLISSEYPNRRLVNMSGTQEFELTPSTSLLLHLVAILIPDFKRLEEVILVFPHEFVQFFYSLFLFHKS